MFGGELEVDESYFGGHRKGKRRCSAGGKIPVFGLLKRAGKDYTKIIPDASSATLMPLIEGKITPDSIVFENFCNQAKRHMRKFNGVSKAYIRAIFEGM